MVIQSAPAEIAAFELAADIRTYLRCRDTPIDGEVGLADILDHLTAERLRALISGEVAAAICFGEDAGWWEIIPVDRCLIWTEIGARLDA